MRLVTPLLKGWLFFFRSHLIHGFGRSPNYCPVFLKTLSLCLIGCEVLMRVPDCILRLAMDGTNCGLWCFGGAELPASTSSSPFRAHHLSYGTLSYDLNRRSARAEQLERCLTGVATELLHKWTGPLRQRSS